jgi:hypothetical protein
MPATQKATFSHHREHREKNFFLPTLCSLCPLWFKFLEVGVYTLVFKGAYLLFFYDRSSGVRY